MNYKQWVKWFLGLTITFLLMGGVFNIIVDPYFHFHMPIKGLQYSYLNERYLNDGIIRHFDYDAIITGTSMTENFKTSEFDKLFGVNSIKIPFSGATFKEINNALDRAFRVNPEIKTIVRSVDASAINMDKDSMREDAEYPDFLYDDNILNDIKYIFNLQVSVRSLAIIIYNLRGMKTTTFDEYANWSDQFAYGKLALDEGYVRPEISLEKKELTDEEVSKITDNIEENLIVLAKSNPQTEFYFFFPPYSIYWWDSLKREGCLDKQIDIFEKVSELLVIYENIHLFTFFDESEMICNLDNYKDYTHYGEWINSQIMVRMKEGKGELSAENYKRRWEEIRNYYKTYNYDIYFKP